MQHTYMSKKKKKKIEENERRMSQHLKRALSGELTRFLKTRQIPCAKGGVPSNVAPRIKSYMCVNITGKQAEFKRGCVRKKKIQVGILQI